MTHAPTGAPERATAPTATPYRRALATGLAAAVALGLVLLAFVWPAATADPHDVPLGIAGPAPAVSAAQQQLSAHAPGTFETTAYADRADAVGAIRRGEVRGALVVGESVEVLTASAAGPAYTTMLSGLTDGLAPPSDGAPQVSDVVAFSDSDPRGAGFTSAVLPLVLGGMLGGVVVSLTVVGVARRLLAALTFAVVGGVVAWSLLGGWLDVVPGPFLGVAGTVALSLLATSTLFVGLTAVLGRAGVAVGAILTLLVGNPLSGAAVPPEMVAGPWGEVGQWMVPGATVTALRSVAYLPDAATLSPLLALAGWAAAGVTLAVVGARRRRASGAPADALADAPDLVGV